MSLWLGHVLTEPRGAFLQVNCGGINSVFFKVSRKGRCTLDPKYNLSLYVILHTQPYLLGAAGSYRTPVARYSTMSFFAVSGTRRWIPESGIATLPSTDMGFVTVAKKMSEGN